MICGYGLLFYFISKLLCLIVSHVLYGRMLLSFQKNALQEQYQTLILTKSSSHKQAERSQQIGRTQQEDRVQIECNPSLMTSKVIKKRRSKKEKSSFWPQQLKRIIQSNKLTINISENLNNQESLQLRAQNFYQLQSQLVRNSVFEYYKQLNQKIGEPQNQILKEYKLQHQRQIRFRLDPSFKIKMRKNIYQKQVKQSKRSQSTHLPQQIINNVLLRSKKQDPRARFSQKFHQRKDKWKLTDFFNSIISQQQKAKEQMGKRRLRIELAVQLSKLEKKCEQLEQNQNQKYLLETFQKFNEKVNDKLCKKQRRLSKVKFTTQNGSS